MEKGSSDSITDQAQPRPPDGECCTEKQLGGQELLCAVRYSAGAGLPTGLNRAIDPIAVALSMTEWTSIPC